MKIFFDTEFTGLHQKTTLISIGLVTESDHTFYAELDDYDRAQINEWLQQNVISQLAMETGHSYNLANTNNDPCIEETEHVVLIGYNRWDIADCLHRWLSRWESIEMWGDCLAWDWVLFCELFGGAFKIPNNVNYIPRDLSTLLYIKGYDPDINREQFVGLNPLFKHDALWDAKIIRACYFKLMGDEGDEGYEGDEGSIS